uniref:Cyclin-like domain-containing protein n=1 Tax=Grammatophora oceanica TaxID=210454 RepID=A0A7S1UYH0_9STRA|mmetsp:Transcript_29814/g.43983  ORF Transcript_29814/g.43983 Transcript_29814/m.43983 type:complete len:350 (+) Transcript_29814:178-1227(+)|eukprot:CAMPEP_0194048596 /NCGR_PEP_ID=MMETSP0009_2-20130614/27819_1 /TAXON_ID=210454 /ORGANISM="Grammatophora oceanica, Strain CCMP 410" /LENGTH=349 /DNA_ID=CAMNT_0038694515 /DNA_START=94 /DNA_END=1143 /DNA_ORIENTATION=-
MHHGSPANAHVVPTAAPLLSLRMRASRVVPPTSASDEVHDRLRVLRQQESSPSYKCNDYLLRRKLESDNRPNGGSCSPSSIVQQSEVPLHEVDTLCREKMVDWSYRVIDHFHASRELVAIAFQYLDRFIDKCSCDRTSFKLAAMTSLYVATKVFHARELSMSSLADLSRGEFDVMHIAEMEGILLETLEWRMHPPTVQDILHLLQNFLPCERGPLHKALYQRAIFFAELSTFDYCFVTQPRTAIAIACLLNAMEGMEESVVTPADHASFVRAACHALDMEYSQHLIESIRNRLWYVYSQSAQYQEDEILPSMPLSEPAHHEDPTICVTTDKLGGDQSPISIVSSAAGTA